MVNCFGLPSIRLDRTAKAERFTGNHRWRFTHIQAPSIEKYLKDTSQEVLPRGHTWMMDTSPFRRSLGCRSRCCPDQSQIHHCHLSPHCFWSWDPYIENKMKIKMQLTIDIWGNAPAAIRFLPTRPLSSVPRCRACAFLTKVLDKGKLIQHVMAGGSPNGQFQLFMWWQSVPGQSMVTTQ